MPITHQIKTKNARIGLWKIKESTEELQELYGQTYQGPLSNPIHIKQYLASRIIIRHFIKNGGEVKKDAFGKPFIEGGPAISISHSYDWAAVMLSEVTEVGIDIEHMNDRIAKIKSKFMGEQEELNDVSNEEHILDLYRFWSSKEAVYKWYGRKSVDFKRDLKLIRANGESNKGDMLLLKKDEEAKIPIKINQINNENLIVAYTNE